MVSAVVLPLVKLERTTAIVSLRKHSFLVDESFLSDIDEACRKPLLDDWRTACGEQIAKMFCLCSEKAWKDLQDVAHALKGSSAQIGAVTMSESAAKIEALARDGEESLAASLNNEVRELAKVTDLTLVHFALNPLQLTE
jgi:HPt (histidine-containing phosphotransfer) domain-containing protein